MRHVKYLCLLAAFLAFGGCATAPSSPASAPPPAVRRVANVSPDALAGNWLLAVQLGGRTVEGSLHFSVIHGVLAGTWTSADGREFELSKIAIDGDGVSWESDGPAGRMAASGKIDGSSMKGTMKRVARAKGDSGSAGSNPPPDGETAGNGDSTGGGGRGGRGRGGRGGRGRGGSGASTVTWTAFKSIPQETGAR